MSIHYLRRLALPVIAAALAVAGAACQPHEVDAFLSMGPQPFSLETATPAQHDVIRAVQDQQTQFFLGVQRAEAASSDCYSAMEAVFPPSTWAWGRRIIARESGNQPSAANPSSSARGCWQLLSSLHAGRYAAVGCHVSQWADARCNTRAAYNLYQSAGTSPWNL